MPGQEAWRGSPFPILKGPTRVWPCTIFFSPTREDEDAHEIPRVAEPFWLALRANVEIIPEMAQDDFAQAAPVIEQAAAKYW
jgi:hypothetical protein